MWSIMFLGPVSFLRSGNMTREQFLLFCVSPLLMMVVFYMNYLWLTPRCFVRGKHRYYLLWNVLMVVCLGVFLHYTMVFAHDVFDVPVPRKLTRMETVSYIMHDIFNLAVSAAVATGIVLALRWQHNEEARLAAEAARTDAELKNLRSQINPHFLLNTLNNIYALTAIDQTKAQEAIQQLSKLLRHMLYDNQEPFVELQDEIQFVENYVSLMKIRLSQDVDVTFVKNVKDPYLKVAPLLFISLVENAFKHGISPTEHSFVHIAMLEDGSQLRVTIENSYHPKNEQDRSGHGIGLNQVQRRLDLAYPARYDWQKGLSEDGKTYTSQITIIL
jgi:LytS/YehU family sensor histidine kinase